MKNAKVKSKDGKHKKLRVAKFNFCTIGMPFPFRNSMTMYDCSPHINNNYMTLNKNYQNDFSTCCINVPGQSLQSSLSPQQSSPISVNIGYHGSARSSSYNPFVCIDPTELKASNSDENEHTIIKHQYHLNQTNNFTNTSKNIDKDYNNGDESYFSSDRNQKQLFNSSSTEELLNHSTKKDDDIKFSLLNYTEPYDFQSVIPSSFDIVKRGPLPSIMLRTNGKIEFSDL